MRTDHRQQADAGAQLLSKGAALSAVARTCLPVGLTGMLLNHANYAGLICAALFLLWASAEWFGAHVRLNRRLLRRVAHDTFQMESLDEVLGHSVRSLNARIHEALAALRMQKMCTAACVALTVLLLGHVAF